MDRIGLIALCALLTATMAWGKTGRTYYDDELMAEVRDKIASETWAANQVTAAEAAAERWVAMSDQELWDFVPPPGQLRALNVSFGNGCPEHGTEVFRRGGHYPWIMSADEPFKVKCPVDGETYPSNDFEPWNPDAYTQEPETGPEPIDYGAGWVDEEGKRYFFVAHYVFWHRWQRGEGRRQLARAGLPAHRRPRLRPQVRGAGLADRPRLQAARLPHPGLPPQVALGHQRAHGGLHLDERVDQQPVHRL